MEPVRSHFLRGVKSWWHAHAARPQFLHCWDVRFVNRCQYLFIDIWEGHNSISLFTDCHLKQIARCPRVAERLIARETEKLKQFQEPLFSVWGQFEGRLGTKAFEDFNQLFRGVILKVKELGVFALVSPSSFTLRISTNCSGV